MIVAWASILLDVALLLFTANLISNICLSKPYIILHLTCQHKTWMNIDWISALFNNFTFWLFCEKVTHIIENTQLINFYYAKQTNIV